jgi:hypothetical protein
VWYPIPSGHTLKSTPIRGAREPAPGEIVNLFYLERGGFKVSAGTVGNKIIYGENGEVTTYEFDGSTVSGSCGGVYIAQSDGYLVGRHGMGNDEPSVIPKFYPIQKGFYDLARAFDKKYDDDVSGEKDFAKNLTSIVQKQTPAQKLEGASPVPVLRPPIITSNPFNVLETYEVDENKYGNSLQSAEPSSKNL